MSKKITLIVLAFFASIFLVACGKSPDVTANANGTKIGDTIKIGAVSYTHLTLPTKLEV